MDILYVIGRNSAWQNNELRYSLRSLSKYGVNIRRIFIAGYCPDFIDRRAVTFVACDDEYSAKHKNILRCIEKAVALTDIADDFLLSSDDHFYVRETDFDNYPIFRKGALPESVKPGDKSHLYTQSLVSTSMVLKAAGLTTHNFSWHGNTHFNRTLFCEPQFEAIRHLSFSMAEGCEPTCLMLNYQYGRRPFEWIDRHDRKFGDETTQADFANGMDAGRECFSSSSKVMRTYLATYLTQTFPHKCQYEL